MNILKRVSIAVILLSIIITVVPAKDKDDDESFWDKMTDIISDDDDNDDDDDSLWDKITDIISDDDVDETLRDISEDIDIDDKEKSLVEDIEDIDILPDMITDSASYAIKSASDIARATLINDKELSEIADEDIKEMDENQTIAKDIDQYYIDLQKVMKKLDVPKGFKLDVKVYMNPFLYIFTLPNGSIRVNSGIIETFNDSELLFLMAHELAHLREKDHKSSYRKAHAMFALENAINISGDIVGATSNGLLESVTSSMRKSQFQKDEEFKADEYAIEVLKKYKIDKKVAVDALKYLQYMNSPLLKLHPTAYLRIKHIEDDL